MIGAKGLLPPIHLIRACQILLWHCTISCAEPHDAGPGRFDLFVNGDLISLQANNPPILSILSDLEDALAIDIRVRGISGQLVSGSYNDVTVDRFLMSLGINYILFYQQNDISGSDRLTSVGVSKPASTNGDPELDC